MDVLVLKHFLLDFFVFFHFFRANSQHLKTNMKKHLTQIISIMTV